jgi:hypothetical protein
MPLSFGIPLGFLVIVVGGILFFATSYKKAAKVYMAAGLVISVLTFILLVLALNSQM